MNYYIYFITPFVAWFVCGIIKFFINSIRTKRLAFDLIGYGGMPSNHSAIVMSMVSLIGLKEGIDTPAFGVALSTAFIVLLDAASLRNKVGQHAKALNELRKHQPEYLPLRERIGHSRLEIGAGILVGFCVAYGLHCLLN